MLFLGLKLQNLLTKDLSGKILERRASKSSANGLSVKPVTVHAFLSSFFLSFQFIPQSFHYFTFQNPKMVNTSIFSLKPYSYFKYPLAGFPDRCKSDVDKGKSAV